MEFIVAQAISVLTTIAAILSMQFKSMKPVLWCQILSNLLCATTFILLDAFSGSIICLIAIVQCLVIFAYNTKDRKPPLAVILGFILLYIAASVFLFQSFADIFSAMAAVIFAIGMTQKKASAARLWYVANPLFWIVYDLFSMAYGNIITHSLIFISTLIGIIRLDLPVYRAKKKAQAKD